MFGVNANAFHLSESCHLVPPCPAGTSGRNRVNPVFVAMQNHPGFRKGYAEPMTAFLRHEAKIRESPTMGHEEGEQCGC